MGSEFRTWIDLIEQMERDDMKEAFKIEPELKGAKLKALDTYNANITNLIKTAFTKAGFSVSGGIYPEKKSDGGRMKYRTTFTATGTSKTSTRKKQDVLGQTSVMPAVVETESKISITILTHLDQAQKMLITDSMVMDVAAYNNEPFKSRVYKRACEVMSSLNFRKLNFPKSQWQSAYTRQDPM